MMKMKLKLRSCLLPFKSLVRIPGSASSPAGGCAGVTGVSFPLGFRRLCGCGGPLCQAGRHQAAQGGPFVSYWWVPGVSPLVSPGLGGVVRLGVGVAWLRGCVPVPPALLRSCGGCALVGWGGPLPIRRWVGFPPSLSFFLGGGVCLFLPLPYLSRCMHWSLSGMVN